MTYHNFLSPIAVAVSLTVLTLHAAGPERSSGVEEMAPLPSPFAELRGKFERSFEETSRDLTRKYINALVDLKSKSPPRDPDDRARVNEEIENARAFVSRGVDGSSIFEMHSGFEIVEVRYGTPERSIDLTRHCLSIAKKDSLELKTSGLHLEFSDPAPGAQKYVTALFRVDGKIHFKFVLQNTTLTLP